MVKRLASVPCPSVWCCTCRVELTGGECYYKQAPLLLFINVYFEQYSTTAWTLAKKRSRLEPGMPSCEYMSLLCSFPGEWPHMLACVISLASETIPDQLLLSVLLYNTRPDMLPLKSRGLLSYMPWLPKSGPGLLVVHAGVVF